MRHVQLALVCLALASAACAPTTPEAYRADQARTAAHMREGLSDQKQRESFYDRAGERQVREADPREPTPR